MKHKALHGLKLVATMVLVLGYTVHSEILIATGYAMHAIEGIVSFWIRN
jgi:hypothetical protein